MNTQLTVKQLALLFLGFTEEATPTEEDVNKAYRKVSLVCHPDTGGNAQMFRALTLAKEFLTSSSSFVSSTPKPTWQPPSPTPPARNSNYDDFTSNFDDLARRYAEQKKEREEREKKAREDTDIPW